MTFWGSRYHTHTHKRNGFKKRTALFFRHTAKLVSFPLHENVFIAAGLLRIKRVRKWPLAMEDDDDDERRSF